MNEQDRQERARGAANARWAQETDRTAATDKARQALKNRFASEEERTEYYQRLARKSAETRAAKKAAKAQAALTEEARKLQARMEARRRKYGLTTEAFAQLLEEQAGVCAICRQLPSAGTGDRWYVDHDHACCPGTKTCGECVRGILCLDCNIGIARFADDWVVLRLASEYLRERQEKSAHTS